VKATEALTCPRWRSARRRLMCLSAVIAIGFPVTVGAAARASALPSCPGTAVVFARGTDEPPGIGCVGEAFVDSLRAQLSDEQVAVYAVDYPASHEFVKAVDGATDARARIEAAAASCPDTAIVLGGYSQGAAVIDLITGPEDDSFGFGRPLSDSAASHVAAVTVFGNPLTRFGRPLTTWSRVYGAMAIDLCNGADPVCSDGSDVSAHSHYVEAGLPDQAAEYVEGRLRAAKGGR
jgi:cutinase